MPDSTPNSPSNQQNSQSSGQTTFWSAPYFPAGFQTTMGQPPFPMAQAAPRSGYSTDLFEPPQASAPPRPLVPTLPNPIYPAGRLPFLAPIDTDMALGTPYGYMLQDFETFVIGSLPQPELPASGGYPAESASLEAKLAGCSLDETGQPFDGMGD